MSLSVYNEKISHEIQHSYNSHTYIQLRNIALFKAAKNSKSESSYCIPSIKIQLMLEQVLVNGSSLHGSFTPSPLTVPIPLSLQSHDLHAPSLLLSLSLPFFSLSFPLCLFSTSDSVRSYLVFVCLILLILAEVLVLLISGCSLKGCSSATEQE